MLKLLFIVTIIL